MSLLSAVVEFKRETLLHALAVLDLMDLIFHFPCLVSARTA